MENSIRQTFLSSRNANRKIDLIWRSRVRQLIAGIDHLPLLTNAGVFLHIIPPSDVTMLIDRYKQETIDVMRSLTLLFGQFPKYHRVNIDGLAGYDAPSQLNSKISSCVQLFWDGSVEFYDAAYFEPERVDGKSLPNINLPDLESNLVEGLQSSLKTLKRLEIQLPLRVCLAIVGAKGYGATASNHPIFSEAQIIDRQELFFEPVMIDDWDVDLGQALRPIFDQVWNACGYMHSSSYRNNGEWKPNLR